jgi:hypothetical protein
VCCGALEGLRGAGEKPGGERALTGHFVNGSLVNWCQAIDCFAGVGDFLFEGVKRKIREAEVGARGAPRQIDVLMASVPRLLRTTQP